jgi:hypothetical protein
LDFVRKYEQILGYVITTMWESFETPEGIGMSTSNKTKEGACDCSVFYEEIGYAAALQTPPKDAVTGWVKSHKSSISDRDRSMVLRLG